MWELKYEGELHLSIQKPFGDYAVRIKTYNDGAILKKEELFDLIQHLLQYYLKAEDIE